MAQIFTIAPAATVAKIQLTELANGSWSIRDECNSKGGIFFTHKAAARFIRDEFGANSTVVTSAAQTALAA